MAEKLNAELLKVDNLSITFSSRKGFIRAVRGVSLSIRPGESYALIGESGSGKSTIAFGILNYLAANGMVSSGTVHFKGENLLKKKNRGAPVYSGQQNLDGFSGSA